MLAALPCPAIIAHRGASAYAPENTLAAFKLAARQGADAVELDAKLSADGQVVVIHDRLLDRTTDGSGPVRGMDSQALRRLDAGSWFEDSFCGERIPTLAEVFAALPEPVMVNVELTNYASPLDGLPEKVAAIMLQLGVERRVLVSSFNPLALFRFRRILPAVPLGLLAAPGSPGVWARSFFAAILPHQALHPHFPDVDASLIAAAHRKGRRVFAYTVNRVEDMRLLFRLGVDGIFTDDPLRALQLRAEGFA